MFLIERLKAREKLAPIILVINEMNSLFSYFPKELLDLIIYYLYRAFKITDPIFDVTRNLFNGTTDPSFQCELDYHHGLFAQNKKSSVDLIFNNKLLTKGPL